MVQTEEKPGGSPCGDARDDDRDHATRHDGESRWRDLLELDATLHSQRNIRLLTPEARVLLHLRLEGSTSVSAAMQVAGTSQRGFYAVIDRLKAAGLVATVKDRDDQRVRRLSLDPAVDLGK